MGFPTQIKICFDFNYFFSSILQLAGGGHSVCAARCCAAGWFEIHLFPKTGTDIPMRGRPVLRGWCDRCCALVAARLVQPLLRGRCCAAGATVAARPLLRGRCCAWQAPIHFESVNVRSHFILRVEPGGGVDQPHRIIQGNNSTHAADAFDSSY